MFRKPLPAKNQTFSSIFTSVSSTFIIFNVTIHQKFQVCFSEFSVSHSNFPVASTKKVDFVERGKSVCSDSRCTIHFHLPFSWTSSNIRIKNNLTPQIVSSLSRFQANEKSFLFVSHIYNLSEYRKYDFYCHNRKLKEIHAS